VPSTPARHYWQHLDLLQRQLKGVPIGIGEQMMEALSRGNTRVDIEKKEDWSVISQSSFL
jgi:hypothetical protein